MKNYINFICNALLGANPRDTDAFFELHQKEIENTAKMMQEKHPIIELKSIYRGIILKDQDIKNGVLEAMSQIKYLSFSEDVEIAKIFANTESTMSSYLMAKVPDAKGYLITHTPSMGDILYHHSWVDVLGLDMFFGRGSMAVIREQKEIILKQRGMSFKLQKV